MNKRTHALKRLIKKNKLAYKAARKVKHTVFPGSATNLEIYDFQKYYPSTEELKDQRASYKNFKLQPKISIVMPTYNTNDRFLRECIDSVLDQSYPNWELCIADDASPQKSVVATIKQYAGRDSRIRLVERKQNGHISLASNSAIEIATGEYLALLDHDDFLWPNALYEIVKAINSQPDVDFIYCDEDKIDEASKIHSYPFFKPDWSPEFLESCNYITHFSCIRKAVVDKVGGFRKGYEGAQDWDLFIRVTEVTERIYHTPKVLYSWRVHESSTAQDTDAKPYVYEAQKKLLEDHVKRTGAKGDVHPGLIWQHSIIEFEVEGAPSVQVVIYGSEATDETANKLVKNSGYSKNVTIKIVKALKSRTFEEIIKSSNDDYYVLLPADTIKLSDKWLYKLLADCQRDGVGVVGGRLLSADSKTLYSAGIGVGLGQYYLPLLNGESTEDNHYMRALHGKSRRDVSAVYPPLMVSGKALAKVRAGELKEAYFSVDLCLSVISSGFRCVYSPYIAATPAKSSHARLSKREASSFKSKWSQYVNNDPYVNPNYVKSNGKLEVA